MDLQYTFLRTQSYSFKIMVLKSITETFKQKLQNMHIPSLGLNTAHHKLNDFLKNQNLRLRESQAVYKNTILGSAPTPYRCGFI